MGRAAKKSVRPSKPRRAKQTEIPGTERIHDDELSSAAERLRDVRAERMALSEEETAAAARLLDLLRDRKLEQYVDEEAGLRVARVPGHDRVSVKRLKTDDDAQVDELAAE